MKRSFISTFFIYVNHTSQSTLISKLIIIIIIIIIIIT